MSRNQLLVGIVGLTLFPLGLLYKWFFGFIGSEHFLLLFIVSLLYVLGMFFFLFLRLLSVNYKPAEEPLMVVFDNLGFINCFFIAAGIVLTLFMEIFGG